MTFAEEWSDSSTEAPWIKERLDAFIVSHQL